MTIILTTRSNLLISVHRPRLASWFAFAPIIDTDMGLKNGSVDRGSSKNFLVQLVSQNLTLTKNFYVVLKERKILLPMTEPREPTQR